MIIDWWNLLFFIRKFVDNFRRAYSFPFRALCSLHVIFFCVICGRRYLCLINKKITRSSRNHEFSARTCDFFFSHFPFNSFCSWKSQPNWRNPKNAQWCFENNLNNISQCERSGRLYQWFFFYRNTPTNKHVVIVVLINIYELKANVNNKRVIDVFFGVHSTGRCT